MGEVTLSKTGVSDEDARAISERLKSFARERYDSWAKFIKKLGISRTTAVPWARVERTPSVPEVPRLLHLARATNVSLDWLLLGEGSEVRVRQEETPAGQVEAAIEAELRQSEAVSDEDFEAAWHLLTLLQSVDGEYAILRLAVDGVRPRFQECVRLVDHYARLAVLYNHARLIYERSRSNDSQAVEASLQEFRRLWSQLLPPSLGGNLESDHAFED